MIHPRTKRCPTIFHSQTDAQFVPQSVGSSNTSREESDRKCLNHAHAQSFDRCEAAVRVHIGQTTEHAQDLSTSGHFPAMCCSIKHSAERTVRPFVNEILLGIFLFVAESLP